MNLTVFTQAVEEKKDSRGVVSEDAIPASQRVITNVRKLELDFDRNVFRVEFVADGTRTVEHGELNSLYADGVATEWFNFNVVHESTAKEVKSTKHGMNDPTTTSSKPGSVNKAG